MKSFAVRKVRLAFFRFHRQAFFSLAALLLFSTAYHLYFAHKIIPGVIVGGVKVGGLNRQQALTKLNQTEAELEKTLNLWTQNGQVYRISTEELDLEYDWEASIARAYEVGRTGNFFVDTKDKLAGLVKPLKLGAKYTYNKDVLGGKVAEIRSEVNIPSVSANIALNTEGKLEIVPEIYGKSLDEDSIYDVIRSCLDQMHFKQKTLEVKNDDPQFTKQDLEKILNKAQERVGRQLTLIAGERQYVLNPKELIELVEFIRDSNGATDLRINKKALEKLRGEIGLELNKLPLGQVAGVKDGRVTEFRIIQEGLEIDQEKFDAAFKKLFDGRELTMDIPLKEISTTKNGAEYGIFFLLGTGNSKFTGSAQPRITNLSLAAQRISGVLVPPGKEFSFNKAVGEISSRTGYATAYIISQGRTVLGEGGGVCQTSTTLFRAILNAGLPITSRHPHAYRVGYYELESPVGYDASVYQPSLDFKFVNDTPGYVLIQSATDLATNSLTFHIYGTPDGRRVEMGEPKLYNVVGAPAPLYQDDPTLPAGVVKQIDFAAPGGTAVISRKVTKGDEILFEDTFKTVYQPWRAIFLVGTKK
ncbi:VanW family protein [Patescibacteria group bacterium]|nr:VanW family protein [Patescibacteria group bacterium]MBU1970325.1 VanW family protein [Patescibacteria group bacterium]